MKKRQSNHRLDDRSADRERPTSASIIYGVLPVLEALRSNARRIDKVLIVEGAREARLSNVIDMCRQQSVMWHRVPRATFGKFLDPAANHQGVLAFAAAAEYTPLDDLLDGLSVTPLLVLLDGVEDPRNLGAILRVAECAAADGVIIPERRAAGLTDTVAKSAAGAIEHIKVAKASNLNSLIKDLKARDIWVVGTAADASTEYTAWDWQRPSAIVLGGEGGGLHRLVAENCDVLVKIPMYGKIDSLNVSVAAGVILFEARRQREVVSVSGRKDHRPDKLHSDPLTTDC